MSRIKINASLLLAVAALAIISRLTQGQEAAKTGTIEGTVENALIRSGPAVVYLKNVKGEFKAPDDLPVMDQEKLSFKPHVLPVLVGTTVKCPNSDTVQHNIFSPANSAKAFNLGLYPPGQSKDLKFEKVGVVPLLCNVHAEMSGFIVVLPNPYYAMTDKEGKYKIENVPPGEYKLSFWHEKLRPETVDVPVKAEKTTHVKFSDLKKGKYSVDLLK